MDSRRSESDRGELNCPSASQPTGPPPLLATGRLSRRRQARSTVVAGRRARTLRV